MAKFSGSLVLYSSRCFDVYESATCKAISLIAVGVAEYQRPAMNNCASRPK